MSSLSTAYVHVFRGKSEWGEPPPEPSFVAFKDQLSRVIAGYPVSLENIPPDPDLTEKQWKTLNYYFRWWRQVTPQHIATNSAVNKWLSGQDTYEDERGFWAGPVYNAFAGEEWYRQVQAWREQRRAIIDSRRYATARGLGVVAVFLLALLPVLSVLDFSRVAISDIHRGVVWSDSGVKMVRGFAEKIAGMLPWKEQDALGNERDMTSDERRAGIDDMIGLAAWLFFPIAWIFGPICFFKTLGSAYDIGYQANEELKLTGHRFTEQDRQAMDKGVDGAIKRTFGWSVLGAMFWWIPAVIAAAIGFLILMIVVGIAIVVGKSVEKVTSGKD